MKEILEKGYYIPPGDFEYFGFLNGFYTGEGENAI